MKRKKYCGLAILMAGLWGTTLHTNAAENYLGAEAVLQKIKAKQGLPAEPKKETDPQADFRKQIADFGTKVRTMPAPEAAKGWLGLFDQLGKARPQDPYNQVRNSKVRPVTLNDVMEVLPPPASWAELEKAVLARPAAKGKEAQRENGLKLLVHTLNGNTTARQAVIQELEKQAKEANRNEAYLYHRIFETLREAMLASIDDPKLILTMLEQNLAEAQTEEGNEDLRLPNLVVVLGEKEAEAFLRKALVAPKVKVHVPGGTATQRLAQKLALELVNDLKTPQWGLASSLSTVELYEALEKKFAPKQEPATTPAIPGLPKVPRSPRFGMDDHEKQQASLYYLLGLIAKNRTADAVKVAKAAGREDYAMLPEDAISQMEKAGYSKALADFFHALLTEDPGLPFWYNYVKISANVGQTDRMLELARQAAARKDLPPKKRAMVANMLTSALLAADKVEEGVAQLISQAKAPAAEKAGGEDEDAEMMYFMMASGQSNAGLQLIRIGHLMNKPEWLEEGLKITRASLAGGAKKTQSYSYSTLEIQFAGLLAELGRGAEAEQVLLEYLTRLATKPKEPNSYGRSGGERKALLQLATLYSQAGRHADVLALYEQAPWWEAKDAQEFYLESAGEDEFSHFRKRIQPAGHVLAQALIKADRKEQARPIIHALLDQMPGNDRGYELLAELDGAQATAKLDELYARDQYEERPLIWKGKLLFEAGKVDEAEQIIRKAVTVDPSDGEQGPNDRMRVYAILADIRERKGDKKEADILRGAVKAIRLSEQADQFAAAGLLKRAVQMYRDSLKHFADAYCIQSRLAVQLSEMGLHSEAEAYYQKAYELMPDSFGRVESHCFGCERAFDGDRAQSIAEKVFNKLATERPNQPQVHYLLGYLRHEQERHDEALPRFLKAVELDPEYLNAWVKLQETMEHVHQPLATRDRVTLAIVRLDPLGRHARTDFKDVANIRALWELADKAQALVPKPPTALYELAAAKKALEEKAKNASNNNSYSYSYTQHYGGRRSASPAQTLQQLGFVQAAMQMMGGQGGMYW
jgi:tetratricopeptide (TPR) repeat protein